MRAYVHTYMRGTKEGWMDSSDDGVLAQRFLTRWSIHSDDLEMPTYFPVSGMPARKQEFGSWRHTSILDYHHKHFTGGILSWIWVTDLCEYVAMSNSTAVVSPS